MPTAADYLRETSLSMNAGYRDDCATHACRLAELLLDESHAPWIGRLRDLTIDGDRVTHGPLIPTRFTGRGLVVWTTHYIACSGRDVYDPIAGVPLDLDEYSLAVFGRPLTIETHLDAADTERLLRSGDIRRTFHPATGRPNTRRG